MKEEEEIKDEAWALHNAEQLLGWGHARKELYYLFAENMGVPLSQTPFANNHQELQYEAEGFYISHYHLQHG